MTELDERPLARGVSTALPLSKGPLFVAIFGRKKSGKSELARVLWLAYPRDRLVIDPTGDVRPTLPENSFRVLPSDPLPSRFPKRDDEPRASLLYKPSRKDPAYAAHFDAAIGLAVDHPGDVCLWIDEVGRAAKLDKTFPRMSEVLEEGRHAGITLIACGPRPTGIDPLVIAQADFIYIFDLPNVEDRRKLAGHMGYDADELADAVEQLPEHGYLRFDASQHRSTGLRLVEFDPLPLEAISAHTATPATST